MALLVYSGAWGKLIHEKTRIEKSQLCAGVAPGQTYGCIRSAVGWGWLHPPPPLLAWGGENLLHLSSPVKETVQ